MNLDGNDYGIWINWSKNIFITNTLFFVNAFNSSQNVWNVWVGYRNCPWSWKNNNEMLTYIIDEKIWSYFKLWSILGVDRNKYIVSFAIKMPKNIHRYTLQNTHTLVLFASTFCLNTELLMFLFISYKNGWKYSITNAQWAKNGKRVQ